MTVRSTWLLQAMFESAIHRQTTRKPPKPPFHSGLVSWVRVAGAVEGSWGCSALSAVNQCRKIVLAEEANYVTACWWILNTACTAALEGDSAGVQRAWACVFLCVRVVWWGFDWYVVEARMQCKGNSQGRPQRPDVWHARMCFTASRTRDSRQLV